MEDANRLVQKHRNDINVITQALTITGVSLIVAGVAGIIYMLMGVAGMAGGARGRHRASRRAPTRGRAPHAGLPRWRCPDRQPSP